MRDPNRHAAPGGRMNGECLVVTIGLLQVTIVIILVIRMILRLVVLFFGKLFRSNEVDADDTYDGQAARPR
jgi:hypothetical protein